MAQPIPAGTRIGIIGGFVLPTEVAGESQSLNPLKRASILFDRLLFLDDFVDEPGVTIPKAIEAELDWLKEKRVLIDLASEDDATIEIPMETSDPLVAEFVARHGFLEPGKHLSPASAPVWHDALDTMARAAAVGLNAGTHWRATAVLPNAPRPADTSQDRAVSVVINALPMIDDSTPWEQVLEFRDDLDARGAMLRIADWMNEVTRAGLDAGEMGDKLGALISQYDQHMKVHRIKANRGALESFVVTTFEFLEDLVHLKFGKAAAGLFTLQRSKIALMEAELAAPGRDVAFVSHARDAFARPKKTTIVKP